MTQRKDVLIARLSFVLLIVLIIGIIVSVATRISASRKNQKQIAEVVEETQETEEIEVDNTEFSAIVVEPTEEVVEETVTYVKTTAQVNFRKDPTTDGELISTIEAGEEMVLEDEADGWSKVTYQGETGYVNSDFVEVETDGSTDEASEEETKATITAGVNFRSGPGTDYSTLGDISADTEVTIISEEDGWVKINYNGQEGYVNADYVLKE